MDSQRQGRWEWYHVLQTWTRERREGGSRKEPTMDKTSGGRRGIFVFDVFVVVVAAVVFVVVEAVFAMCFGRKEGGRVSKKVGGARMTY